MALLLGWQFREKGGIYQKHPVATFRSVIKRVPPICERGVPFGATDETSRNKVEFSVLEAARLITGMNPDYGVPIYRTPLGRAWE